MTESIRFAASARSSGAFVRALGAAGLAALLLAPLRLAAQVVTFETGRTPTVEIHVAVTGSDQTGDGSAQSPYASISRAVRDAAPGSAIRVHPGNYAGGSTVGGVAGTQTQPIWIGGVPGQAKPALVGGDWGLLIDRGRYLIIHDIVVRGAAGNGINAADGGDYANFDAARHFVFRDLEIYDIGGSGNQDCLKLSGVNDFFVLDSVFARCGGGLSGSGIDCVGCHDGHIEGNHFASMSGNAVQAKGASENIRVHRNTVVDGGAVAFHIGGATGYEYFRPPLSTAAPNYEARNIRVTANVVVGGQAALSFVGAVDSLAANNTIVDQEHWLIRILQGTVTGGGYVFLPSGDNTVVNNLFYFARSALSTHVNVGPDTDPGSFVFANNLWYAHDNYTQSQPMLPVPETDGIVGQNPLMVAPGSADYHLQSTSPAIGAGRAVAGLDDDFDGIRYSDPPSIGAFEGDPPGRFNDVPPNHWAYNFIEAIASAGISTGCSGNYYCPSALVTRAQMAVFLERGMNGSGYSPPAASGVVFLDVGSSDFAASFIEQLYLDGISGGCGGDNYCPALPVSRAQMAVFLLRTIHGAAYAPPAPSGIFQDVGSSHWAAPWIEQLAVEGVSGGCGNGNYCPDAPVTRDQMAVLLVRAFVL